MRRKMVVFLMILFITLQLTACMQTSAPEPVETPDPAPAPVVGPVPPASPPEPAPGVDPAPAPAVSPGTPDEPEAPDPPQVDPSAEPDTFSTLDIFMNSGLNVGEEEIIIENEADLEKYKKVIEDIIKKAEANEKHKYNEHIWVYSGYGERHPHYKEYKCDCGATLVTGETADYEMKITGPSKEHPHYMLEECSICGGHFENSDMPTSLTWILHGYTANHPHYMVTKCSQCDFTETITSVTALQNGACRLVSESATADHPHYRIITCTYEGCDHRVVDKTHTAEWEIEIDDEDNYSVAHPHYLFGMCGYDGCGHVEQTNQTADWTWDDGVCSICGQHKKLLYTQTPTGAAVIGVHEGFNEVHYEVPATIGHQPVTEIWPHAFANQPFLQSVVIPEGVQLIAHGAFMDCPELTSVFIPASVHMIEDMAFAHCPNLQEVEIEAMFAPALTADVFMGCHPEMTVFVPQEAEGYRIGPWEAMHIVWR